MDRDRIKIIEFGDDGVSDSSEPRPAARAMGEKKIKILEFEGGPEQVRPEQTAEPAVGHIKIMEFDGGPGNEAPRRAETPTGAPSPADIKVREFGAEPEKPARQPGTSGIKIVEFD